MSGTKDYSLGCDLGSSAVKIALLDAHNNRVHTRYKMHKGEVLTIFHELLHEVLLLHGDQIAWAMVQGSMATGFHAAYVANEIAAVVEGAKVVFPACGSIVDIGGESARYITDLDSESIRFGVNSSCSAGTGSFFEDQMTRLSADLENYNTMVAEARTVPRIAGRCTVFAKTDIIHRQQEGVATADILLGLAYAVVRNFKGTIIRNLPVKEPVLLCGGVSLNAGVRSAVRDILKLDTLYCGDEAPCLAAIGCAALARKKKVTFIRQNFAPRPQCSQGAQLPPLLKQASVTDCHRVYSLKAGDPVYLGIDIGSTSTNLVLVNAQGQVVDYQYLRTSGEPLTTARRGIQEIYRRFGTNLDIAVIGTTGSGRSLVGKALNAGVIKDEITAQARGARVSVPEVDTIFEIGGQDSKFIRLTNGQVCDFHMNKVCAAGTGSFVEEQAERLDIPLETFGALSLSAKAPCELGERCTVFIQSQAEKALAQGAEKAEVAAGICYAIVHNYLHKVVGNANVGKHICLSGGIAHNPGIVAAFRHYYPHLQLTPYFSVSGAYGIALIAREQSLQNNATTISANGEEIEHNIQLYHSAERYFYSSYTGHRDPRKKTIGIPRALMLYKMFPMAYNFFRKLGYNVLLSPETDEEIIRRSQELAEEETCFPVKLILGHLSWLEEQGCDAIFIPSVYTMRHAGSHLRHNYGCVFMQNVAARFAAQMQLHIKGIEFLNPVLEMDMGAPQLAKAMLGIGRRLGHSTVRSVAAMAAGGRALKQFSNKSEEQGRQILASLQPGERVLVLITRAYGIDDATLSMGIADQLLQRGCKVITLSHLEDSHSADLSCDHPNLYWPFGAHILTGMKIVRNDPRLFAVYLTNHGCGPDSMLAHQAAEIMGDKPWLHLEVDEHYSPVGLVTRVEAFLSALESHKTGSEGTRQDDPTFSERFGLRNFSNIDAHTPLLIPELFPYSTLITARLCRTGYLCRELPATDIASLQLGRSATRSKEYVTFTTLLGDVLKCVAANPEPHQLILAQNSGAEADGQFSRAIRSHLDTIGRKEVVIYSPLLEELHHDKAFWLDVLAADVLMCAPPDRREHFLSRMTNAPALTLEIIRACAEEIGGGEDDKPMILLQGEPTCVFNPQVNGHLFTPLELEYRILHLPMAEYLLFLWQDNGTSCSGYQQEIRTIAQALGRFSPYSAAVPLLIQTADAKIGKLAGANGRYRMAKSILSAPEAVATIEVAPLYENVATLLSLATTEGGKPLLRLSVNGEGMEKQKLDTFLHFLKN